MRSAIAPSIARPTTEQPPCSSTSASAARDGALSSTISTRGPSPTGAPSCETYGL
jgi:hypothetical protein